MVYDKKAYCKGALCRRSDRKFTSIITGKKMCGQCSVKLKNGKYCTKDELYFEDNLHTNLSLLDIINETKEFSLYDVVFKKKSIREKIEHKKDVGILDIIFENEKKYEKTDLYISLD